MTHAHAAWRRKRWTREHHAGRRSTSSPYGRWNRADGRRRRRRRRPTTRTPTTRIERRRHRRGRPRASALLRALDPLGRGASSPSTGSRSRSSSRGGSRVASTTSSRSRTSSGLSPRRASLPGLQAREGRREADVAATRTTSPGGRRLLGHRDVRRVLAEFEDGATIVLQGLHHPGCRSRSSAGRSRRSSATRRRPTPTSRREASQGLAGPPRHARRLLAPGRGREALARLRARLELPLKHQRYQAGRWASRASPSST